MFTTAGETRLIMGASVGTGASPTACGNAAWLARVMSNAQAAKRRAPGSCTIGHGEEDTQTMIKFLLWLLLLVFCWPLAILALVLWPIVWLISLPFRLLGIAVDGVFSFLRAIVTLPARVLGGGVAR